MFCHGGGWKWRLSNNNNNWLIDIFSIFLFFFGWKRYRGADSFYYWSANKKNWFSINQNEISIANCNWDDLSLSHSLSLSFSLLTEKMKYHYLIWFHIFDHSIFVIQNVLIGYCYFQFFSFFSPNPITIQFHLTDFFLKRKQNFPLFKWTMFSAVQQVQRDSPEGK